MKKNTILKVLSFVLLLTFVFSAVLMTGCGKQEDAAKQTDLEATNADLKSAKDEIAKLQTALNELKEASATSEELTAKAAALQTKIDENKAALDELKAALEAQGTETGSQSAATKEELEAKIQENVEAIEALTEELATTNAALETATADLGAAIQAVSDSAAALDETYATDAELAAAISGLKETVAKDLRDAIAALADVYATKESLTKAISDLENGAIKDIQDALAALDDTYATDEDLANALTVLSAILEAMGKSEADLTEVIGTLNDVLADRLVKSDWIAATDVLFDDNDPRSIAAFKAGIVRVYLLDAKGEPTEERDSRAIPYEDEDIEIYAMKADLLADKLLRAISLDDIDATFALRDEMFARLIPIVDKFEAELQRLEPEKDEDGNVIPGTGKLYFPQAYIDDFYGNNPTHEDQLARLDYLKMLIDEYDPEFNPNGRGLFPTDTEEGVAYKEAQEARYDAIHEAQDNLRIAEAEDDRIYERQVEFGLGKNDTVIFVEQTWVNLESEKSEDQFTSIKEDYRDTVEPQLDPEKVDTTYYAVGIENLPGYQNYQAKLARYYRLMEARDAFAALYPKLTFFKDCNESDPTYSDYSNIEEVDGTKLDDWIDEYDLEDIVTFTLIDENGDIRYEMDGEDYLLVQAVDDNGNLVYQKDPETGKYLKDGDGNKIPVMVRVPMTKEVDKELENVFLIVDEVDGKTHALGGYKRVLAIRYFVQELHKIYKAYVEPDVFGTTKNLVDQVKIEIEGGYLKVLWKHIPTLNDIFRKKDAIYAAIKELTSYGTKYFDLRAVRYIVDDEDATLAFETDDVIPGAEYKCYYGRLADGRRDMLGFDRITLYDEDKIKLDAEDVFNAIRDRANILKETTADIDNLVAQLRGQKWTVREGYEPEGYGEDGYQPSCGYVPPEGGFTVVGGTNKVKFKDSNDIMTNIWESVKALFTDAERDIYFNTDDKTVNKTNYDDMTRELRFDVYPHLEAALKNLVEYVQAIYDEVKGLLRDDVEVFLPNLNKLLVAQSQVFEVQAGANVDDTNFWLLDDDETDPEVTREGIQYSVFFKRLTTKVVELVRLAEAANKAAEAINAKIEALGDFNLNKTVVVDEIIDGAPSYFTPDGREAGHSMGLIEWAETYLGIEFVYGPQEEEESDEPAEEPVMPTLEEKQAYLADIAGYFVNTIEGTKEVPYKVYGPAEDGSILVVGTDSYIIKIVKNEGVLGVHTYNNKDNTFMEDVYEFVTGGDFTTFKNTFTTRIDKYNAAKIAWDKVDMTPVANRKDIDASFEAFAEYVKEYYTNFSLTDDTDEYNAIIEYYKIGTGGKKYYNNELIEGAVIFDGGIPYAADPGDKDVTCYPIYQRNQNNEIKFDSYTHEPLIQISAATVRNQFAAETKDWEDQWVNGERDVWTVYYGNLVKDGTATEGVMSKAARFASYITGAMFDDYYDLVDAEDYEGEFGELTAYEDLVDRSNQYDAIMLAAKYLDLVTTQEDGLRDDVIDLKEMIDTFRSDFDYEGEIYDSAYVGVNGKAMDAGLVAYVGAAKVYVLEAFERIEMAVPEESYKYVKWQVTIGNHTYTLPTDEGTVKTTYCVEMIQKPCKSIEEVDGNIAVFCQQALKVGSEYPKFDYASFVAEP